MSLRMGSHRGSSRGSALDKRVPKNPRYAGVKSKVETGMTVDKVTFVTTRQHLRRQEEPYFRLTPSQLSELLSEYEQEEQEGVHDFRDHIDPDNHGPKVVEYEPEDKPRYDRPYLILDVRPSEEFKKSRIVQARSFEAKLLNQDRMTPELYMYKNREGGLVVLYSNDDAGACHAARTFIQRGFDNVFVLSGGLVAFARAGFHCFVEGNTEPLQLPAASTSCGGGGGSGGGGSGGGGSGGSARRRSVLNGSSCTGSSYNGVNHGVGGGGSGGGGEGRRLDYRYGGGQSVVVRGGGEGFSNNNNNNNNNSTTSSKSGSFGGGGGGGGGGLSARASARGQNSDGTFSAQIGGGEGGKGGRGRSFGGYPGGRHDGGEVRASGYGGGGGDRDRGGGGGQRPQNIAGLRGGCRGDELAEAAAAASAARRRSLQAEGGGRGRERGMGGRAIGDESKGSAITVADSVISRSTARRGRW